MSSSNLQDAIVRNIKRWTFENVHTCLPARITDVSQFETTQMITVKPVLNRLDEDGVVISLPPTTCPVQFPSGGGGLISFPLRVGDTVSLMFSMMSLAEWLAGDGSDTTPFDRRRFSYGDAVAITGLYTSKSNLHPNPDDVEIKFNNSSFKLRSTKNGDGVEITTSNNVEINCVQANVVASESVTVDSPTITLGLGGAPIARLGDSVEVNVIGGSSAGTHSGTITSASSNNTSN